MANLSSYLPGGIDPAAVTITGGTINGTTIGASTPSTGAFTTFTSTGIDDNATSTAITIDSSQNLGIGTSSPASLIHGMSGDLFLTANSTAADSGQGIYFQSTTSGWSTSAAHGAIFGKRVDASNGYLRFDTRSSGTTAERMRLDASGNINVDRGQSLRWYDGTIGSGNINAAIEGTGDPALKLYTRQAGTSTLTERMRIDTYGKVGIGTTSPSSYNSIMNDLVVAGSADSGITIASGTSNEGSLAFADGTSGQDTYRGWINYNHFSNFMRFYTNAQERMRIDGSGALLIGRTSGNPNSSSFGINFDGGGRMLAASNYGATGTAHQFYGNAGSVRILGDGDLENTNNSYTGLSDARLKSNIVDASSQIDDIMAVQVRSYTLNETGATHIGVVAQELEASGMSGLVKTKDDGMKSVKYSILYLKAVKALQEAVTRIETLEAEVAALKGA